jgi:hypothetical protein
MIILQESASNQTINFIPRSGGYDTLVITDEQTGDGQTRTIPLQRCLRLLKIDSTLW